MPSPTGDESERFRRRYAISDAAALIEVELEAMGSDFGANGYTTMAQADELGRVLELAPGLVLLDLGSGCGWPGLYLAGKHGCTVISIDPIAEGVATARHRGLADGMGERSWAVRSSADPLPIRPGSVDAIVHADLLC